MTEVPIHFGDCSEHEKRNRHRPDYTNCSIKVHEGDWNPDEAPHRLEIDLAVSSRSHRPVENVNVTLYAVGGHILLDREDAEGESVVLLNIIRESIPIQRWMRQTIKHGKHGWERKGIQWGMLSERSKGYIIVATLDIPELPGVARIQPSELNPARDLLVAVYCSRQPDHGPSHRCE